MRTSRGAARGAAKVGDGRRKMEAGGERGLNPSRLRTFDERRVLLRGLLDARTPHHTTPHHTTHTDDEDTTDQTITEPQQNNLASRTEHLTSNSTVHSIPLFPSFFPFSLCSPSLSALPCLLPTFFLLPALLCQSLYSFFFSFHTPRHIHIHIHVHVHSQRAMHSIYPSIYTYQTTRDWGPEVPRVA